MRRLVLIAITLVFACKDKPHEAPKPERGPPPPQDPCKQAPEAPEQMWWIKDDLALAQRCAKEGGLPIVMDFWAPWCHTCLSMQTTVFTDPSFAAVRDKFVFASFDTDREVNAAVVDKYPLSAWPTFYVTTADGTVLARYVGAASVAQFHAFLTAGTSVLAGTATGPDAWLIAAEKAIATKDLAAAQTHLVAALSSAPDGWPRRADALVSLIHTVHKRNDLAGCLDLAEGSLDDTGATASASDFVSIAADCATARATAEPARVAKLRERMVARVLAVLDDPKAQLSADDRSDAMLIVRGILIDLGKTADAKAIAERQRVLLDEAAAKATTPVARMTYNYQRADVYVYLGRPMEIVPALEASAKELPKEYDPRARLGRVLLEAGQLADAAKWTDEALALVYGPRKARVLAQRAEIAAKQGDKAGERAYREQIVKLWESLPPGQANAEALESARKQLERMDAPAAGSGAKPH